MSMVLAQIPVQGLVAWFPFSGGFQDESGSGIVLTARTPAVPPVPVADRFGTASSAYSLNGTSNSIRGSDALLPMGNSPRTISLWLKAPDIATIFSYGKQEPGKHLAVRLFSDGQYSMVVSTLRDSFSVDPWINMVQWSHLCVTYDGSVVRMYANGALKYASNPVTMQTEPEQMVMGGWLNNPIDEGLYQGSLDDIAVYSRCLTAAQVAYLAQSPSTKNNPPSITTSPLTQAKVSMPYTYSIAASDANQTSPLSYLLTQNPTGMSLQGHSISWTPSVSQIGLQTISIVVTDNAGDTAVQTYTVNVEPTTSVASPSGPRPIINKRMPGKCFSILGRNSGENAPGLRLVAGAKVVKF